MKSILLSAIAILAICLSLIAPAKAASYSFFSTTNFGATHLAQFDTPSSSSTVIGEFPSFGTWDSLAFDPDGHLYAGGNLGNLIVINQVTATSQLIGNVGFELDGDMSFDNEGRLFAFSSTSTATRAYELDPSDATPTFIANFSVPISGLAYDYEQENFLALGRSILYTFSPIVPSLNFLADLGFDEEHNYLEAIEVTPDGDVFVLSRGGHIYQVNDDYSKNYLGKPVEFDARSLAYGPTVPPEIVLVVDIDIKPGNKHNVINPRSKGGIWVAILSDAGPESPFDPTSQVNIPTVEFGPDGAKAIRHKVKDVNKDGLGDLLLRFKIPETGISCGDTDATLTGETFDGQSFTGTDSIKTVGCKTPKKAKKEKHKGK